MSDREDRLDALFAALADPIRRELFRRLVAGGPDTATHLAMGQPVSRQAIVKHVQVLAEAELLEAERHGREVRYRASAGPLTDAVGWLLAAGAPWDRRLERLRSRLASVAGTETRRGRSS